MDENSPKRIVVVGKTGAGKSSLGNTIFGKERFKMGHFSKSETTSCQVESSCVGGRNITFIDTPALFDTEKSEEELKPEILRCIIECAPEPHAFLIVLKVERYTEQEEAVVNKFIQLFSPEAFKYAAVVFTHGDQLPEGMEIQDFVSQNEGLCDLVKKCGGRCHVIDNKYWKNDQQDPYRNNQFQVAELLNTVDKIVEDNKGGCYTNKMLQAVEREIQKGEERIRNSSENSPKKIAVVGKTGAGKSSLGNTIFGEPRFKLGHFSKSETTSCQVESRSVKGRNITFIDTPGFFDTHKSEEELKAEIVRCMIECAPELHAFLIVLKVERYTEQEEAVVNKFIQLFSPEAFKYAAVVFTHGDQLDEGMEIKEFVSQSESLCDLVKKCGGRCHVIDNKYWKDNQQDHYRSNQFQVAELLKTVDKIVEDNNGDCYTNELLQDVEREIQKEEGDIQKSSGNITKEEIRNQAKTSVFGRFLIKFADTAVRVMLGALFGLAQRINEFFGSTGDSKQEQTNQQKKKQ